MTSSAHAEIFAASTSPAVSETGGSYGQKGVDFQRYWAISRIIELASAEAPDFLILFESLQDVVEFDSPKTPTKARVYQLKMKGTGDWSWKSLTALPLGKARKKKNSDELTTPKEFLESPIGKLAATVAELTTIEGEGVFVSNLGSSADLKTGSVAGSVCFCKFSELSEELQNQIQPELAKLKKPVPLDTLHLHKTDLSLDDPDTHVTGKMSKYLAKEAPRNIGQCKSFSDSLFAVLSARGRKTDPPQDFDELVRTRGYSKSEFLGALELLRATPDQQALVNSWLARLQAEKMPIRDFTKLQLQLTRKLDDRLRSGVAPSGYAEDAVHTWVAKHPIDESVLQFIQNAETHLASQFPEVSRDELRAIILLEGVAECLNQI